MTIAREMNRTIDKMTRSRARVLARTEIIHAHAEGQLDSFEDLGVEEVGVEAEWSTAGDMHVCPVCSSLQGVVMSVAKARGLIPRHPQCRCAWIPANVGESAVGQKRGAAAEAAMKKSILAEKPGSRFGAARDKSAWRGKIQVPKEHEYTMEAEPEVAPAVVKPKPKGEPKPEPKKEK